MSQGKNMLNQDVTELHDALAAHYPVSFAQDIADKVVRLHKRDIQLLDIKALNDLAAEYRTRIRTEIVALRARRAAADGSVRAVYIHHELVFARRQIADLWAVYRIVTADAHDMTADYLAQLARKTQRLSPTTTTSSSPHTRKMHRAAA